MADASGLNSLEISEHIGSIATGDNINAKRVANYVWDGSNWNRQISTLFSLPYDSLYFTNADGNGNYQTITSKLSGATVQTLSLTFDGSNNTTSILRS